MVPRNKTNVLEKSSYFYLLSKLCIGEVHTLLQLLNAVGARGEPPSKCFHRLLVAMLSAHIVDDQKTTETNGVRVARLAADWTKLVKATLRGELQK